jgi:hypothetical protein
MGARRADKVGSAMTDRPRTLCPTCHQAIEPDESEVVEAIEVDSVAGFGAPADTADAMRVVFHPTCFPEGDPSYRRLD